jgi:transcriptional regulator with XRE-family HTH domain
MTPDLGTNRTETSALRRVATRVRAARVAKGISLERLGRSIGITVQQINRYETARCHLTTSRLASIASALELPLSYFFEDADFPAESPLAKSITGSGRLALLSAYSQLDPAKRNLLISIAKSLAEVPSERQANRPRG